MPSLSSFCAEVDGRPQGVDDIHQGLGEVTELDAAQMFKLGSVSASLVHGRERWRQGAEDPACRIFEEVIDLTHPEAFKHDYTEESTRRMPWGQVP